MPRLGSIEHGYISKLIFSRPKTEGGLVDLRGFDWCAVPHDTRTYPEYHEDCISKVDFSNSKADEGFWVCGAVFEECIFDESIWWCMKFTDCKFIKCSFNDCLLYNCFLSGKFYDCTFKNLYTKGEIFSFCAGSEYKNCIFENVKLRKMSEEMAVTFEDCKIDGTLEGDIDGGVFRGWRYALKERFRTLPDLFDTRYRPVKFIRCDLSNLRLHNVVFEKDIVFKDNKVGDQTFFNESKK